MSYLLVPKIEICLKHFFRQKWPKTAIVHRKRPKGRPEGSSRQDRAVAAVAASGQAVSNLEGLSRQLGSCCQLQAAVMAAALPSNATCARHEGHIRPHTRRTEACSRQASCARAAYRCRHHYRRHHRRHRYRRRRRFSSSSLLAPVPRKLFFPSFQGLLSRSESKPIWGTCSECQQGRKYNIQKGLLTYLLFWYSEMTRRASKRT